MVVKQVLFKYGNDETEVFNVTKVNVKTETEDSQEATFSGTLSSFTITGYSIDIERIALESKEKYKKLIDICDHAANEGIQITTMEERLIGDESFVEKIHYFDCKGSGEVEISPGNTYTTEKLSFKASSRKRDDL